MHLHKLCYGEGRGRLGRWEGGPSREEAEDMLKITLKEGLDCKNRIPSGTAARGKGILKPSSLGTPGVWPVLCQPVAYKLLNRNSSHLSECTDNRLLPQSSRTRCVAYNAFDAAQHVVYCVSVILHTCTPVAPPSSTYGRENHPSRSPDPSPSLFSPHGYMTLLEYITLDPD